MKKNSKSSILISTGGTGGHVFPAQAMAEEIISRGYDVIFVSDDRGQKFFKDLIEDEKITNTSQVSGCTLTMTQSNSSVKSDDKTDSDNNTSSELENEILSGVGKISYIFINTLSYKGKFRFYINIIISMVKMCYILYKTKPNCAIGFGGYASFAPILSCYIMKIPTLLHQSDIIVGKANRFLTKIANKLLLGMYDQTFNQDQSEFFLKYKHKIAYCGIPIRNVFKKIVQKCLPQTPNILNILIIGGSSGAKMWSKYMLDAARQLPKDVLINVHITQQCLNDEIENLKESYTKLKVNHNINSFFTNINEEIAKADVIFARAGASSIAEGAYMSKAMLVVPYPFAAQNHQYVNASYISENNAGWMIEESVLSGELLRDYIIYFYNNMNELKNRGKALHNLISVDARNNCFKYIEQFLPYKQNNTKESFISQNMITNDKFLKKQQLSQNDNDIFGIGGKKVFIIGIGGIGMRAVTKALFWGKYEICGSDISSYNFSDISDMAILHEGHDEKNIANFNPDVCVYSSAIKESNSELSFAKRNKMKLIHRSEMLAQIAKHFGYVITISGAHGKTTTTSLIAMMFYNANASFCVMNGGIMLDLNSNFYQNLLNPMNKSYFINEGDESDNSFLCVNSDVAVITNIDMDHINFHIAEENLQDSFITFLINSKKGAIINANRAEVIDCFNKAFKIISTDISYELSDYKINPNSISRYKFQKIIHESELKKKVYLCCHDKNITNIKNIDLQIFQQQDLCLVIYSNIKKSCNEKGDYSVFDLHIYENLSPYYDVSIDNNKNSSHSSTEYLIENSYSFHSVHKYKNLSFNMIGDHNIENAALAIGVGYFYKIDIESMQKTLSSFSGTKRRFCIASNPSENCNHVTIIDDYAHHPAEIRAAISVAKLKNINRIIAVIQIHKFYRLESNFDEFADVCCLSDMTVVLPIFDSGAQEGSVSQKDLYDAVVKKIGRERIFSASSFDDAQEILEKICQSNDMILCMGAASMPLFINQIVNAWKVK